MLRSMYSGISGMRNFQTKLDVIGNNIANVSTFGFKKSRITFNDMVNQTISGASGPSTNRGGRNPQQVGLGSSIGTIDTIHTVGNLQNTGRPLDLGIDGDGFFVVADKDGNNKTYTRAGNFYLDKEGYVVNSEGKYLMAIETPATTPPGGVVDQTTMKPIKIDPTSKSFSIGADGKISVIDKDGVAVPTVPQIAIAKFANSEGLQKVGGNSFQVTDNSGKANFYVPQSNGSGSILSGKLEMSNVDLSEEFTEMIVAQRGFQANSRIITTSDQILEELVNLKR
ncbi:MAG: flagellar basal body rod protein FlgG [Bacilli bacterium]